MYFLVVILLKFVPAEISIEFSLTTAAARNRSHFHHHCWHQHKLWCEVVII